MSELEIRFAPKWLESFLFFCWVIFFGKKEISDPWMRGFQKKIQKTPLPLPGSPVLFQGVKR